MRENADLSDTIIDLLLSDHSSLFMFIDYKTSIINNKVLLGMLARGTKTALSVRLVICEFSSY